MYRVRIEIVEETETEESNHDYKNRTGRAYDYTEQGGPKIKYTSEPRLVGKGEVTANILSRALDKAEAFLGIHEEVSSVVKAKG